MHTYIDNMQQTHNTNKHTINTHTHLDMYLCVCVFDDILSFFIPVENSFYRVGSNKKPEGNIFTSVQGGSVFACARTCLLHESCVAFAFNDESKECDLFNSYPDTPITSTGWDTYTYYFGH